MLQLSPSTRYYWYHGITDMRKGFDALCGIVLQHMQANVLQGGVYIFVNRKRNQIKLLTWEGDGLPFIINAWKRVCMSCLKYPLIRQVPALM